MRIIIDMEVKEWNLVLEALDGITHGPKGQEASIEKFSKQVNTELKNLEWRFTVENPNGMCHCENENNVVWDGFGGGKCNKCSGDTF